MNSLVEPRQILKVNFPTCESNALNEVKAEKLREDVEVVSVVPVGEYIHPHKLLFIYMLTDGQFSVVYLPHLDHFLSRPAS